MSARSGAAPDTAKPARREPRRVTQSYLENAALHYLERFATSTANLRRVLMRKVDLSARAHGTDREEGAAWVEALLARYQASGLLDDAGYAEMRAGSLHRRGASTRAIREKLAAKGVAADEVAAALERLDADTDGSLDTAAALALARRRRLGPYRPADTRAATRDKDLAALGRAGFDYATARRVVDADDPDDVS